MKIAFLSHNDVFGGAAKATYRLYNGYSLINEKTSYIVKNKQCKTDNKIIKINPKNLDSEKFEKKINKYYIDYNRTNLSNTLFTFSYGEYNLAPLYQADIINLHWVEGMISLNALNEIVHMDKPIVWTLHDMRPFTGGCHYSSGCNKYIKKCTNCPQLITDFAELTGTNIKLKQKILKNANVTIVSPSQWLAKLAAKSSIFKNSNIKVIPNSLDINTFKVMNKNLAKKRLGIKHEIVILFGSINYNEERKGFHELASALSIIKNFLIKKKVLALFFGENSLSGLMMENMNFGYVNSDEKLNQIYNAADIFVLPSLEDNLPNTMIESLACGTPVIAFNSGGISEVINDNNGCLVPRGDIHALANAIKNFVTNKSLRKQCGVNGRQLIERKFQLKHQASAYHELFNSLHKQAFKYKKNKKVRTEQLFQELINQTKEFEIRTQKKEFLEFSSIYSKIFQYVEFLTKNNNKIVIYGYGSMGKTLNKLLGNKVLAIVDKASNLVEKCVSSQQVYSPHILTEIQFDLIIISVMGREAEVINYLTKELLIEKHHIACIQID